MNNSQQVDPTHDAWQQPRKVVEGCHHKVSCKCGTPFWLRPPTSAELEHYHPEQRETFG
jgi:hypothetical protein